MGDLFRRGGVQVVGVCAALALVALASASAVAAAPKPERVRFDSAALGKGGDYLVLMPPGGAAGAPLPYIVLLHGLGGEPGDWLSHGALRAPWERAMASGALPAAALVMPNGHNHYWTDHLGKPGAPGPRWGGFVRDVMRDAEARFNLRGDRGGRAIVGVSMGGHGALSVGLQAPDAFAAIVSLGGAMFPEPPTHRGIYKRVWGFPADRAHWEATSPVALMAALPTVSKAGPALPAIYLQCGDDDAAGFLEHALDAHRILLARKVPHELRVNDGGHTWAAWRAASDDWLAFVGRAFTRR